MVPKFGTSGLRGAAEALTAPLLAQYIGAFAALCPVGGALFVGRDLRASTPRIAADVIQAARAAGLRVRDCGALPTPALALAAMAAGASAVMVTGSHIPAQYNGLKFYLPKGEISKADEAAILAGVAGQSSDQLDLSHAPNLPCSDTSASAAYLARYTEAFGPRALAGLRLGVYQHSSVARDLLMDLISALGACAVPLGRADRFVALDTEAVDLPTRTLLAQWAGHHRLDAILSTDGDADRPLLADSAGRVIAGDILGILTAQHLGADVVCAPVSCNSMLENVDEFAKVHRCKIGSPYVIAAMQGALAENLAAKVVGFEANGGFLLGYGAQLTAGTLGPLMTRDAVLPLIAPIVRAREWGIGRGIGRGIGLPNAIAALPARVTAADRLENISAPRAAALLAQLQDPAACATFLGPIGREVARDCTDGLRLTLAGGDIVHLRASANAPEFRIYTEAGSDGAARALLTHVVQALRAHNL